MHLHRPARAILESGSMNDRERAENVSRILKTGFFAVRLLCALGKAVPVIGEVCGVATEVLREVQRLNDKHNDVIRAGQLVLDVLKLLVQMEKIVKVQELRADRQVQELHDSLKRYHKAIQTFGEECWIKRYYMLMIDQIDQKSLISIENEVHKELDMLFRHYSLARDEKILDRLAVAIDQLVERRVAEVGESKDKALEWMLANDGALDALREQIGGGIDEVKESVEAVRVKMDGRFDDVSNNLGEIRGCVMEICAHMLRQPPIDHSTAKQVEQGPLHTGHAEAGEAVASTSSAPALEVAVLSSIADSVILQGIPVQPAPAVVSRAASPHGMEPLVSEQDVSAFLRRVGCDLSALRDKTFINWNSKRIDDHDCRVIAHLALPASSQSPSMGALGKLACLSLTWNNIGVEGAQHIGEALKINKMLTSLDLQGNNIGDTGAQHIGEALKINKTLTSLDLMDNKIGDEGAQHIGEALKTNKALTSLNLMHNEIGDTGAQHIGEALKINKTLTSLYLAFNSIGGQGAQHIGEALKINMALTALNLMDNKIGDEGARFIVKGLKDNKGLTSLNLWANSIGPEGAKHIGEGLKINVALTSLDLQWNGIGEKGAQHISKALKINTVLTTLDLQCNKIGAEGAQHIGEALKSNMVLTTLILAGNNMGVTGAQHIGEALKINKALTTLKLERNRIGSEGAQHIGEALKSNMALITLNLFDNNIGAEGARCIGEALKINKALTTLNLELNNIGDTGAKHIGEALKMNTALTELDLHLNQIGAGGAQHIG